MSMDIPKTNMMLSSRTDKELAKMWMQGANTLVCVCEWNAQTWSDISHYVLSFYKTNNQSVDGENNQKNENNYHLQLETK